MRLRRFILLVACSCLASNVVPAPVLAQRIPRYGIGVRGISRGQFDSYNLTLSRSAASSASSGGLNVGGCLSGCANASAELFPVKKSVPVRSKTHDGTARTEINLTYKGFGVPTGYRLGGETASTASDTPLGATEIEVSSVATSNPAVLEQLPNIDPAALAAVNAALAVVEGVDGEINTSGQGTFVCQLAICTPEETRDAAEQGLVPIPRYNEAYTNFTLTQQVESTDQEFISNFAALASPF